MEASRERVTVPARFCGPPGVGNGGYVSGLLAERIGSGAEVTLRRATPLGRPLALRRDPDPDGGRWILEDAGEVLAEGRPAQPGVELPEPPTLARAEAARAAAREWSHPFPGCFVCGPARRRGDGLRILPGPLGGAWGASGAVAAPWIPDAALADAGGCVAPRFLWAALDCPGGIAAMQGQACKLVLGRIAGVTAGSVRPGEACVVVGWRIGREGRKHTTGTALFTAAGALRGHTRQVWIEI